MTLGAPVPAFRLEIWKVVGWKCALPWSQTCAREFRQRRGQHVHRVLRQLRIGHVALHALHGEAAAVGTAAADLDRVADALLAGGLAHDAPVDARAARLEFLDHALGAVDRWAFLVAGDQEGNGARVLRVLGHEGLGGGQHGGEAALHVCRAAPVQPAVLHGGLEGLGAPFLQRAGGDHIGMAGEAQHRAAAAAGGPEILDTAEAHLLDREAGRCEAVPHQLLAAPVHRGHGGAGDQLLGQGQSVRILQCGDSRGGSGAQFEQGWPLHQVLAGGSTGRRRGTPKPRPAGGCHQTVISLKSNTAVRAHYVRHDRIETCRTRTADLLQHKTLEFHYQSTGVIHVQEEFSLCPASPLAWPRCWAPRRPAADEDTKVGGKIFADFTSIDAKSDGNKTAASGIGVDVKRVYRHLRSQVR